MSETIYDRLGGFPGVRRVVTAFYKRILDSVVLEHHFRHADMRRLVDHQTKFMAALMGGPYAIDEIGLRKAHRHLGITRGEFREMSALLRETLAEEGVPPGDIELVLARMARLEPAVIAEAA
ncbi:hemoglobin [Dongia mobilis]|uniref:Hemoglobin n=1 Tax=Dongia mobilis TaxID=578943 RepID=A0A4R6WVU2_9PROT|nr:group 1 truncated hemoglobin [Dongia mobilis]TDQ84579.1 hemoglobin [Dongia mobilis]